MNAANRAASLQSRHRELEGILADQMARPRPDDGLVKATKVKKLRLKEEMERVSRMHRVATQ